jgi:hypothetical protein
MILFTLAFLVALALPATAATPQRLTTNTIHDESTDAALDAAGNFHVVFVREGTIYYRGRTATGWTDEETVATGWWPAVGAGLPASPR